MSSVEHKQLPVFGLQWHPEKNSFVYSNDTIVHSANATIIMHHFSVFLANQLRKNTNVYPQPDFSSDQIWNYDINYYEAESQEKFYFPF